MDATQREILRTGILTALHAAGVYEPTVPALRVGLRVSGTAVATDDEIKLELLYLQDKGLAQKVEKALSPENAKWRITAAGRDHLALEGLA